MQLAKRIDENRIVTYLVTSLVITILTISENLVVATDPKIIMITNDTLDLDYLFDATKACDDTCVVVFPASTGPKGDRGLPGLEGPPGPKGDRGLAGLSNISRLVILVDINNTGCKDSCIMPSEVYFNVTPMNEGKAKNIIPSTFSGSETGTNVLMEPGSYNVSYSVPLNYNSTASDECHGIIHGGETKLCLITLGYSPVSSYLKVLTHVENTACVGVFFRCLTASDFFLTVIQNESKIFSTAREKDAAYNFQGNESGVQIVIAPGAYEVVADELQSNANDNYVPNLSKDCSGRINAGDTKMCSIFFNFR